MTQQASTTSIGTLLLCAATAIVASVAYGIIFLKTRSFITIFDGFGVELPILTRLYLNGGPWLLALGILSFIPFILLAMNRRLDQKTRNLLIGLSVGNLPIALFFFGGMVVAMYLPIFKMGTAA